MFSLKLDKEMVDKCLDGITFDVDDVLRVTYPADVIGGIKKEELLTIKSIKHYNADIFILNFKEQVGNYTYNLNQLLRFKVSSEVK